MVSEISTNMFKPLMKKELSLVPNGDSYFAVVDKGSLSERCYYGWSGERNKYYCSMRAIKNCYTGTYRLIPFIFLPKLSNASYNKLKQQVFEKWGIQSDFLSPKLEYEAIQLFIGQSLLVSWMEKAKVKLNQKHYDFTKIALNFGYKLSKEDIFRLTDKKNLFTWEELISVLNDVTKDASSLVPIGDKKQDIKTYLEDLMYSIIIQERTEAWRMSKSLPPIDNPILRYARENGWDFDLSDIISQIAKETGSSIDEIISTLWSFIDVGYATLSTRKDFGEQALRMNSYALSILPKRYQIFSSVLDYLNEKTLRTGSSLETDLCLFLNQAKEVGVVPKDVDSTVLVAKLIEYLKLLEQSNQSIDIWSGPECFEFLAPSRGSFADAARSAIQASKKQDFQHTLKRRAAFNLAHQNFPI